MKVSVLKDSDVEVETYRHNDGHSIVTVLINKGQVTIEAFERCISGVETEKIAQDNILKQLGFSKQFIKDHSYE